MKTILSTDIFLVSKQVHLLNEKIKAKTRERKKKMQTR